MMISVIKNIVVISATLLLVACVENGANRYYPSTGYSSSQTSPDSVTLQLRNDRGRHYHSGYHEGYSSETSKGYRHRTRRPVNDKNGDIFQGNNQQRSGQPQETTAGYNSAPSTSTPTGPGASPQENLSSRGLSPMPMEIVKPGAAPSAAPSQFSGDTQQSQDMAGYGTSPSAGYADNAGFSAN